MSVKYKDYYKILDVSRSATDKEIKSAFRKLARKYHPDTAGTGDEEKFKELDLSGHVTLRKGERSHVATMAAKYL